MKSQRTDWKQHSQKARTAKREKLTVALTRETAINLLPNPRVPATEFEVQRHLYNSLEKLGYTVRAEVMTKCGTCRFDLIVYVGDTPVRIIEVKKQKMSGNGYVPPSIVRHAIKSQVEKYAVFGIPVDLVCKMSGANQYIEKVKANPFTVASTTDSYLVEIE